MHLRSIIVFWGHLLLPVIASFSENSEEAWLPTSKADDLTCIMNPENFALKNHKCPHQNVSFWLYTKLIRNSPFKLDPLRINPLSFLPRRPVKIIVHGYTGNRDSPPNNPIRNKFLDKDFIVISVDYNPFVSNICYPAAVKNIATPSKCLAEFINYLVSSNLVPNEDIHLIGFSLGAHVVGQAANYIKQPLKWITGLDPAKLFFVFASLNERLDASDAEFVDVIHTATTIRGMLKPMGHIDFYPNFGLVQPGCLSLKTGSCNHNRAPVYYAESIDTEKGFIGRFCESFFLYLIKICSLNDRKATMGYGVEKNKRGMYFLKTADSPPYALGNVFRS